ncbi:MAG: Arm DNA-binding domain-containing protein, partial [Methyloceanibacter sp.]
MAKKLTQISVDKLGKPGRRVEIPDAGKPGLYLVVSPTGRKSWAVRYRRRADGKPRKLTLDGFVSLAIAHKLAQE